MDDVVDPVAPAVEQAPEEFAIVEVFGHRRHAGRIIEVERFGTKLLRIDLPMNGDFANGFTSHFYGGAALFSVTPTDLSTVQRMNRSLMLPRPYIQPSDEEKEDDGPPSDSPSDGLPF